MTSFRFIDPFMLRPSPESGGAPEPHKSLCVRADGRVSAAEAARGRRAARSQCRYRTKPPVAGTTATRLGIDRVTMPEIHPVHRKPVYPGVVEAVRYAAEYPIPYVPPRQDDGASVEASPPRPWRRPGRSTPPDPLTRQ